MRRVLIIDADEPARNRYREALDPLEVELVLADNGEDGLAMFKNDGPFNLVVIDIFAEKIDGFDAIEEINPEESGVPVIAISGRGDSTGAFPLHLALTLGAERSFDKAFDVDVFQEAAKELMNIS
ncbi:MAG: response regulator [Planctomycetota bacterium]|jgi:DNA-binding NtrC family response regulator